MKPNWIKFLLVSAIIFAVTGCQSSEPMAASFFATKTAFPEIEPEQTDTPLPTTEPAPGETLIPTEIIPPPSTPLPPTKTAAPTAAAIQFLAANLTAADCQAASLPEIACTGVSTNDGWTPVTREFDGIPMVLVPKGCFQMGNEESFPEEQPVHEICFEKPYWIDLTEVTVAQFANFLNGQNDPVSDFDAWLDVWGVTFEPRIQLIQERERWKPFPGKENHPLENVTWFGASEYCAWRDAHLPTEAEWEYAARGPDSWLYPWGDEFIADNVVRHHARSTEVGSKPQGASWVGALDMSSSLFEWTSSLYQPYPYNPDDGREAGRGHDDTSFRVLRGSAWYHPDGMHDNISATARFNDPPGYAAWYFGFRCARSVVEHEHASEELLSKPIVAEVSFTAADCQSAGLPKTACTGVSTNDEWTPVIREFDGIPMVLVPAGCFTMGSSDAQIEYYLTLLDRRGLYANEQPAHQQCFSEPFWIDLYEVTNGYFGSYGFWQENDQPREMVSWLEADAYCRERGVRLPTEVEWEYAARGPDNSIYPWGNTFDGNRLNFCDINCQVPGRDPGYDDGYSSTAPVGSFPDGVSWVAAQDMAGNVWEWVSSILLPYPYDPNDGREAAIEEDRTSLRGVRGGARLDSSYVVRASNRNQRENTNYSALYGFRCARAFDSNPGGEFTGQSSPSLVYEPPTDAQLGDTWNRPNDGSLMVFVPGGIFQMGTGTTGRVDEFQDEFPEHPVKLDSFWIDKHEITNKQFAEFMYYNGNQVEGGVTWLEMESEFCLIEEHIGNPWPKVGYARHPVVDISWYGAQAYCDWVGGRLPTEAEWEYAASGPENWVYPWGNEYDCTKGNFHDWTDEDDPPLYPNLGERGCDGINFTSPVDAYPEGASWVGALDLAGNVWDWISDWGISFYPTGLQINPTGPETGTEKIVRGGSWNNHETGVRTTNRGAYRPISRSYYIGFRCVYPPQTP